MPNMLAPFEPFRHISTLQDRIDKLFRETLNRFPGDFTGEALEGSTWAPAVDILETDNEIVLRADLPGIDPKDVDIQIHDGTLTLRGERQRESEVKQDNYHRVERVYGSFMRSFALPQTVESDKAEAQYANGVLELKLPKRPEAKPKQIKVAVKN